MPKHQTQASLAPHSSSVIVNAATRMAQLFVRLFSPYLQGTVLVDLLKQALVDQAREEARKQGRRLTLTEIGLRTGLDTRIVKTMMDRPRDVGDRFISAEAAILAHWYKEPRWRDSQNRLQELPIHGPDGSFEALVYKYAGRGISARAVVDRLVKTGNIAERDNLFVRLVDPNWRFIEDREDEILDYGTQALDSLATCIIHNIVQRHHPEHKWTERRTYAVQVPLSRLRELAEEMNALLLEQKKQMSALIRSYEDPNLTKKILPMGAGYYFWDSNET
ncbi:MAG: hypothetical protein Tsb002_01610 [Wenzhouxiangellaceae bacterium]